MAQKILVISDGNYDNETFEMCENYLREFYRSYEINFKIFEPEVKDNNISKIQSIVDEDVKQICVENYDCVIAIGLSAYFLLQSFYMGKLIVIDPELHLGIENDKSRCFRTDDVICILSMDDIYMSEEYDNVFYNSTVVLSDKFIYEDRFWDEKSEFKQVLEYIVNY